MSSNGNFQLHNISSTTSAISINSPSNKYLTLLLNINETTDGQPLTLNLSFSPPSGFILKLLIADNPNLGSIINNINLVINSNNGTQLLSQKFNNNDSIEYIYDNNTWKSVNSPNLILNKLKELGADDPSALNNIMTTNTIGDAVLNGGIDSYTDGGNKVDANNRIVTLRGIPYDLYKYLDVYKKNNDTSSVDGLSPDGNRLITTEFNDYLNYFIYAMKNNPSFVSSVANQIDTQNNLNGISLENESLITLTYPIFLNRSPFIKYIIVNNDTTNNAYSSTDSILLNTGSSIKYLGSNIIPINSQNFNIKYNVISVNGGAGNLDSGSSATANLIIPNRLISPSDYLAKTEILFTISSVGNAFNFTDLSLLEGIYMIDNLGKIISGTVNNIANNTITYTIPPQSTSVLSPVWPLDTPYYICIIYNGKIYYNGNVEIYINSTPPTIFVPPLPPVPTLNYEYSIAANVVLDSFSNGNPSSSVPSDNSLTVGVNTLINFTFTACDNVFDSTYSFELGILGTDISGNIIVTPIKQTTPYTLNTELNYANTILYGYDQLHADPTTNPYAIVGIITIKTITDPTTNPASYTLTSYYTQTQILLTVTNDIIPPQPTPLLSFITSNANLIPNSNLFPLLESNSTQGDTINFYIYSKKAFIKSVIYFNGLELQTYTQTPNNNTYSGGSTSYINNGNVDIPFIYPPYEVPASDIDTYKYFVSIPIRLTLAASLPTSENPHGTNYYITVATTVLNDNGTYSTYYSEKSLSLNLKLRTDLTIHGYIVNGIVTPSIVNTPNASPLDANAFATINGLVDMPNNSLYYYKTADNKYNGFFYLLTNNIVPNEGASIYDLVNGFLCLQGQSCGTIAIGGTAPTTYHTIINNMVNYFTKLSLEFGFGFRSEIEYIKNNTFAGQYLNIQNLINYIELTAKNIYLCGDYTTNIYIVGNSLPIGTSYYPNNVINQGSVGTIPVSTSIPQPPFAPNPDVNGYVNGAIGATGGISSLYYNYYGDTGPIGGFGEYWGVTGDQSIIGSNTNISQPANWVKTPNLPKLLPTTTPVNYFRGSNSINALNETLLDKSYQIQFSSKNTIIIPVNYNGYGLISAPSNGGGCSQPSYILTIHLNTYGLFSYPTSSTGGCTTAPTTLNGSVVAPGTEVNIVNNSTNTVVRVVSFNLATTPPSPIIINLKDTTMDTLFIKPTDSMHLVFGGTSWGLL